ncbi:MxaK protein [Verminephrobacter aporrectodeae subsp. tuberculatae]|uniref:hypothetical protein n=1 Tax=Verminephrobacter aporrectodeae TaxID=1110389 RepID=UPI0002376547|nr:hypothetical protein [Verminephrobacter aporrectodeae]MCW5221674.1 MxaK protein [Verminephrobacter aporrectodeae subsp. tuberculatae]MCW5290964.1 MxaK protein [Verminephrobacter aporrectodeae subsp. tuberculatae]MCW8165577.1 MxaK protein [Verminephrobacter aporrectodeae subsp. tuberculatae]MCW8169588.1 MxaK protein [Verminephrobacter aporrectodeae subsp. tuberculatae]
MKRRSAHLLFGLLSLCCAGVALERGLQLRQTLERNAQLVRIAAAGPGAAPVARPAARELQLALALAQAQAGRYEAAREGYGALIQAGARDPLAQQALFNLGNLYLRQGLAQGADALPLIELGKQRLRELLRAAPQDWDARYNLERALRLAPEEDADFPAEQPPGARPRVRIPGFVTGDLP